MTETLGKWGYLYKRTPWRRKARSGRCEMGLWLVPPAIVHPPRHWSGSRCLLAVLEAGMGCHRSQWESSCGACHTTAQVRQWGSCLGSRQLGTPTLDEQWCSLCMCWQCPRDGGARRILSCNNVNTQGDMHPSKETPTGPSMCPFGAAETGKGLWFFRVPYFSNSRGCWVS